MKKKILWLMLSWLIVAALVLSSCGEAVPGEQEEEEEEEEPVGQQEEEEEEEEEEEPVGQQEEEEEEVGEEAEERCSAVLGGSECGRPMSSLGVPIYGGVPTILMRIEPHTGMPDPGELGYPSWYWMLPTLERVLMGDLLEYGLGRGGSHEGEWDYRSDPWPPLKYLTGALAESWEVTPDKLVFHIRPGVYFSGISPDPVMEAREYTAADYVFNLTRRLGMPSGAKLREADFIKTPYEETIYAEDKYTVVIETTHFNSEWSSDIIYVWGFQIAPESIAAAPGDWNKIVGTGPFAIKEVVSGSHIEYIRNPYYWKTLTINEVEYELPFFDGMIMPILNDAATAYAALRTGKFDAYLQPFMSNLYADSLAETCPELCMHQGRGATGGVCAGQRVLEFVVDQPPFDNRDVRRALFIGTDRVALGGIYGAVPDPEHPLNDPVYQWPIARRGEGHVPLEDLPASTRELFEYDKEKAKRLLTEAGYPDGFKCQMIVGDRPLQPDTLEMLAGMWLEDFGIEIEIQVVSLPILQATRGEYAHQAELEWRGTAWGIGHFRPQFYSGLPTNSCSYSDPYFDQQIGKASATIDTAERVAILEELFVRILDDAIGIPIPSCSAYPNSFWWPWIKNYYGQSSGYYVHNPPYDMMWFDQDLKAEMGH